MKQAEPRTIRLSDYRPPDYLVEWVRLEFDLDPDMTLVRARMALRLNPAFSGVPERLCLDGEGLQLRRLELDGEPLPEDRYQQTENGLLLHRPPARFELFSEVAIEPRANTALEGLYCSGDILCTQCEAEGFRKITFFPDRPDVMTRFHVTLRASRQDYPVLLSNGTPLEQGELAAGRHYAVWEDPFAKPCYLFALVAGRLEYIEDHHRTPDDRDITLRIYTDPGHTEQCRFAMQALKNAMRWDEEQYGRICDLDHYNIVAVKDFNMGAMENKGLNLFNARFVLASPDTASDSDYQHIEGVIAHEYFHNWTGNRITCRDWFQLSLKEGLTVFRDQEFSADMGARGVKRIDDVRLLRTHQFAEDAGPMAHPVRPDSYIEINNFYTLTVYEKGAELVRMQRNLVGSEGFRRGMDLYFQRFDGQAVTTDDFVDCIEEANQRDFSQFRCWYRYAGTPLLRVRDAYRADRQEYCLSVEQSCPDTPGQTDKPAFHIPLRVALFDADGQALSLRLQDPHADPVDELVLELREARQQFCFQGVTCPPTPSLLRGFSAPVRIDYPYQPEQLRLLMAHDDDGFARWEAGQTLAQGALFEMLEDAASGAWLTTYRQAYRQALEGFDGSDPAGLAEVLSLPSEAYLGERMEVIDPDAIHRVRRTLRGLLAEDNRQRLRQLYRDLRDDGIYRATPEAMGRRRLRNLCLGLLAQTDDATFLLEQQYRDHRNMTDVLAAFALLVEQPEPVARTVIADFYQRWRGNDLVIDKWFGIQAQADRPDALERVDELLRHADFKLGNPNRARSLLGALAANLVHFHHASGRGYQMLADQLAALDPINPQVAARLVRPLIRWRRYDPGRQALMRAQLSRLLQLQALSKDLFEIVDRALAET